MRSELIETSAAGGLDNSARARCERYLANVVVCSAEARDQLRRAWLAGFDERTRDVRRRALAPMPGGLKPRQLATLRAFAAVADRTGRDPTLVEIAAELGVTKTTVFECLRELARKRCLRTNDGAHKVRRYTLAVLVPREQQGAT